MGRHNCHYVPPFLALCARIKKEHNRPTEPQLNVHCNLCTTILMTNLNFVFPFIQDILLDLAVGFYARSTTSRGEAVVATALWERGYRV
jgi:hypothetical protein